MIFRVKKAFRWDGKDLNPKDHIDIPEGHPRLEGLHLGGFIIYDATEPSSDEAPKPQVQSVRKKK